jgi:hypothetical protein
VSKKKQLRFISTERVLEFVVRLGAFAAQFVEKEFGPGGAGRLCVDLLRISLGENELGAEVGDVVCRVDGVHQEPPRPRQDGVLDGLELFLLYPNLSCRHNTLLLLHVTYASWL